MVASILAPRLATVAPVVASISASLAARLTPLHPDGLRICFRQRQRRGCCGSSQRCRQS
jgi:hypothetical protein